MKFYPFQILLIVLLSISFTACDWLDSSEVDTSSNANFVSLSLAEVNEDDAAVADAEFTVEWDAELGDSVIVNLDSLPYNTAIDSVKPTFAFYSTYVAYVYKTNSTGGLDSVALTGTDTLDFNKVVKIKNIASDQIASKTLRIKVNVHKIEPELYQWKNVVNELYTHSGYIQKAIMLNDTIRFYTSTGLTTYLYTSTNGSNWSNRINVPSLPDNVLLNNIVTYKNKAYLFHNDSLIYNTLDGKTWTKKAYADAAYNFKNLLYEFKGKLWALVQYKSDLSYRFATSEDGDVWEILSATVNDNFPIGGYATISFASRTKQPKVLVAGGYNKDGILQNKVWSSENGTYWIDFGKENTTYGARTGASIIYYEDKLLMFGGMTDDAQLHDLVFMQSADEGLSWKNIDTTYMTVREKYTFTRNDSVLGAYKMYKRRFNQSALVDKNKNIILIGGRNPIPQTFTDVWVGRLNKSVFIRK